MKPQWTKQARKRHTELLMLHCVGEATPEQEAEFKQLQTLQRRTVLRPTMEELIWRRDRAREIRRLMARLEEFLAANRPYEIDKTQLTYSSAKDFP